MKMFKAGVKTNATWNLYIYYLTKFKDWAEYDNFTEIIETDSKKLQTKLEDYVLHLVEIAHPNSIPKMWFGIQTFLEMNDVLLNFKKIRRLFPSMVKTAIERGWNTDEVGQMLSVSNTLMQKAIVHFENASGGRLGIMDNLMMKHLKRIKDCIAITGYADSKEEYITFLTPEATIALDEYHDKRRADGEKITLDSPVFRKVYREGSPIVKTATIQQISAMVLRIQRRAGLRDPKLKKGNRFPISTNHGFRHRFDEIIKSVPGVNPHIAEKMFAHTSRIIALDTIYNNPNLEKEFTEYEKIIPYIMIDENERNKIEIAKKEEINKELLKTNNENKSLQEQMNEIKKQIAEMRSGKMNAISK